MWADRFQPSASWSPCCSLESVDCSSVLIVYSAHFFSKIPNFFLQPIFLLLCWFHLPFVAFSISTGEAHLSLKSSDLSLQPFFGGSKSFLLIPAACCQAAHLPAQSVVFFPQIFLPLAAVIQCSSELLYVSLILPSLFLKLCQFLVLSFNLCQWVFFPSSYASDSLSWIFSPSSFASDSFNWMFSALIRSMRAFSSFCTPLFPTVLLLMLSLSYLNLLYSMTILYFSLAVVAMCCWRLRLCCLSSALRASSLWPVDVRCFCRRVETAAYIWRSLSDRLAWEDTCSIFASADNILSYS